MEQLAGKHKSFINGLTKLYDILVAMRYLAPSDVVRPPHPSERVANATLHALGFEVEVIELTTLLPALRGEAIWGWQKRGTEIVPRSKAVCYFPGVYESELIEELQWGDLSRSGEGDTKKLSPWMLRLTTGGQYGWGLDMIYNTRDQKIIEWNRLSTKYWYEIPGRPAEIVLAQMINKLDSLEWIPYYDPNDYDKPLSRQIIDNPIVFQNIIPGGIRVPTDIPSAIEHMRRQLSPGDVESFRQQINRWRALQKLYRDCGWGTESFDGDAYVKRRAEWIRAAEALEREQRALHYNTQYPAVPWMGQQQTPKQELNRRVEMFWIESAGEYAV